MPYQCINCNHIKLIKMKSFKILMMAVLTILSVSIFAQVSTNLQSKVTKQNLETVKCICPVHPDIVMDKSVMCSIYGTSLNLSLKEKMKMEVMKIHTVPMQTQQTEATSDNQCNLSNSVTILNFSPKEKMKIETMKMNTFLAPTRAGSSRICNCSGMNLKNMDMAHNCPMISNLVKDKMGCCSGCRSTLNLSPKEKMKMELMKI